MYSALKMGSGGIALPRGRNRHRQAYRSPAAEAMIAGLWREPAVVPSRHHLARRVERGEGLPTATSSISKRPYAGPDAKQVAPGMSAGRRSGGPWVPTEAPTPAIRRRALHDSHGPTMPPPRPTACFRCRQPVQTVARRPQRPPGATPFKPQARRRRRGRRAKRPPSRMPISRATDDLENSMSLCGLEPEAQAESASETFDNIADAFNAAARLAGSGHRAAAGQ